MTTLDDVIITQTVVGELSPTYSQLHEQVLKHGSLLDHILMLT
mgnify:CR=1 FL=1